MAMKKTLLEITQNVLSVLDSEDVDAIGDTEEALQVVDIIEAVYYDIISTRDIPEHHELIKLTALSDSAYPTHFTYPENVKVIEKLDYKNSDGDYRTITWCDPLAFLDRTDGLQSDYTSVSDKNAGTTLRIANTVHPTFYTSFDDNYIVMNGHETTVEATLQASKVRAYGVVYPVFDKTDGSSTPDLDAVLFPYFINECKSTAQSLLKGGSDPKTEQAARRQKSFMQNDQYKTKRGNPWSNYGR
jgi:hypothetical protein